MTRRGALLVLLSLAAAAAPASAQATGQAWGNVIVDWLATNRLTYEIDLEPKVQAVVHAGQPTWTSVDATPQVAYALSHWIDVLAQVDVAYQVQSDEVNSMSLTPRIGAQLHILDRLLQRASSHGAANEDVPRRRLSVNTLVRLEHADTYYSSGASAKSTWRVRDRSEITYPLNRAKTTDDGAIYASADGELFMPVDGSSPDAVVSAVRTRAGIGYRESFGWRYEALYIWNGKRNAHSGAMAADSHAIDVRIRRNF